MAKRILRQRAALDVACWLGARYARTVWAIGRWRMENAETLARLADAGRPAILCFWHSRLLMCPRLVYRRHPGPVSGLVSMHRDGELVAGMLRQLGFGSATGSSSRLGVQGLKGVVRRIRRGETVFITPDGPRGPRMRCAPGAVAAAKLSGAPLVPVAAAFRPSWVLDTWDRMMVPLPLPLGRGLVKVGAPIEVPADADRDAVSSLRGRLEDELIQLCRDVDTALGLGVAEPAPPQRGR